MYYELIITFTFILCLVSFFHRIILDIRLDEIKAEIKKLKVEERNRTIDEMLELSYDWRDNRSSFIDFQMALRERKRQ